MTGNTGKIIVGIFSLLICANLYCHAQENPKNILLTGVVMDAEEQKELPYVNVRVKNTFYGTATDINGYFSIFLSPGDTLLFTYVGYKEASFVMPFELSSNRYSLLQLMFKDSMLLEEVVVFPWPNYDNFIEAFLDEKPLQKKDLIVEVRRDLQETLEETERSRYYYNQQRYQRLFMMHEIFPPNNFLDPSRWAEFIRDIKGDDEDD